jgi:cation diffusion facilitator CzcD-associated flavoprotein CzcO
MGPTADGVTLSCDVAIIGGGIRGLTPGSRLPTRRPSPATATKLNVGSVWLAAA